MSEMRRRYDRTFREGAVRIVRETGKPVAQVARDLGIVEQTLGSWVKVAAGSALRVQGRQHVPTGSRVGAGSSHLVSCFRPSLISRSCPSSPVVFAVGLGHEAEAAACGWSFGTSLIRACRWRRRGRPPGHDEAMTASTRTRLALGKARPGERHVRGVRSERA
jgi:hypothetical protein